MAKWKKVKQIDNTTQFEALKALYGKSKESDLKDSSGIPKKRNPTGVGETNSKKLDSDKGNDL